MKIWMPTIRAGSGSDVFTLRLAEGLSKYGHEPAVQWIEHWFEIAPWLLCKINPPAGTDIIHAGSWQGFAFKRKGIPLVVTDHNYVNHPNFIRYKNWRQTAYHKLLINHYLRRTYAAADRLITVSNHNAAAMMNDFSRKVDVIHNWVDVQKFSPGITGIQTDGNAKIKLLCIGNPSRWKGSDLLEELCNRLPENVDFLCLGGLRHNHHYLGSGGIQFAESIAPENMPDLYRTVDAVVILSRHESFGYVALEAMACGLPVIGFDNTGTSEICSGKDCALLIPDGNLDLMMAAINDLAKSTELRIKLGNNGRKNVLENYSEEAQIYEYIKIYQSLLNQ